MEIPEHEIELKAIRAQGAGGQNVNKVSSAIHLRFDIKASSLADELKQQLLATHDKRINSDGVVVIKAQSFRSQDKNRADALSRLDDLVESARRIPKKRVPTRPTHSSRRKRLDEKKKRSVLKKSRGRGYDDF